MLRCTNIAAYFLFRHTHTLGGTSTQDQSENIFNMAASDTVYLDFNATTPLEQSVVDAISDALVNAWGNPSSSHVTGLKAGEIIKKSRQNVADMIGGLPEDVIFTSGGTESNNMVLNSAVQHFWETFSVNQQLSAPSSANSNGSCVMPHFVSSNLEHDSIRLVLEAFQEQHKADVTFVPASKLTGCVEVDDIISAIRPTTCMVTVMLANNETGVIQPVAEIVERIQKLKRNPKHECQILTHTDAAQALGKIPVNVEDLAVNYLTIVGHKFYGPRIGALYVRGLSRDTPLYPMFYGGGQERNYRPGTENTAMIAGLGQAARLVADNVDIYESDMRKVRDYLEEQLKIAFPEGVVFNGCYPNSQRLPNTCNMSLIGDKLQGHKVLDHLRYTQASVGAACHSSAGSRVSPILLASGVSPKAAANALRLSVGRHTTKADIDRFINDLCNAVSELNSEN